MFDTLEFLLIIVVFAVILFWYLQNAEAGSDGLRGFLALEEDPAAAKAGNKKAYRVKERPEHGKTTMRDVRAEQKARSTYHTKDGGEVDRAERMRQRFRRQDEARYRVKDKAANYKQRKSPAEKNTPDTDG